MQNLADVFTYYSESCLVLKGAQQQLCSELKNSIQSCPRIYVILPGLFAIFKGANVPRNHALLFGRGVWMQQQREREQHEGPGHEPAGERRRGGGVPNGKRGGGGRRARRRRRARAAPLQEAPPLQGAVPPAGGELPLQPHPHTGQSASHHYYYITATSSTAS